MRSSGSPIKTVASIEYVHRIYYRIEKRLFAAIHLIAAIHLRYKKMCELWYLPNNLFYFCVLPGLNQHSHVGGGISVVVVKLLQNLRHRV